MTSGLPRLLDGIASTIVLARSLFTIAALQLLLVAGAGLALAARLLASLREEESALLRARGATRCQVARAVLAEAVVLGAAAGLAGVLSGTRLTGALAGLGNLRLDGYQGRGIAPLAWLWALAVLVLCAAVMAWPALHTLTPGAASHRRGRQARLAGIAWAGGDLAVVALAAVSVWELRGYSAVAHPATGSLGIDPVVAVAPALALAGVALIPLRGLPLLARLADKATDHERRLAAAMVSWQIARRPIRQAGPALLVVDRDGDHHAGAGRVRKLAAVGRGPGRLRGWLGRAGGLRRQRCRRAQPRRSPGHPGVTAATSASVASIGNGGQMIALDPSTAGKTILLRPDLSPLPLSALWQRITPRPLPGLVLPGQPDRLEILAALGAGPGSSAAAVRRALGSSTAMAWIQDADGDTYQLPAAGSLPADGRPHALVFMLSGPRQASYPLRLLGLTLTYILPPYDPASPTSAPTAGLSIESLAVADAPSGPFGRPFSHGAALAAWRGTGYSAYVPVGPPGPYGGLTPSDGAPPVDPGLASRRRGRAAAHVQYRTRSVGVGHARPRPRSRDRHRAGRDHGAATVPDRPGHRYQRLPGGQPARHRIGRLGLARQVPGHGQDRGVGGQLPDRLRAEPGADRRPRGDQRLCSSPTRCAPLPLTRWWLRTADGRVPRLPAGLGLSVTGRARQQAALLNNPLLTAPRQAMLAIGVAAVLLGVLGFSVSVAASLRSRRTQSAVFAALGVGKNAQAGQLCLEQCALSVPAAAAGLLAGIGLAQLMVPAITLTTDAAEPVPSALAIVPLGPAVALALVIAAVPAAAAALSVLRRPDPAAQLRAEAG